MSKYKIKYPVNQNQTLLEFQTPIVLQKNKTEYKKTMPTKKNTPKNVLNIKILII